MYAVVRDYDILYRDKGNPVVDIHQIASVFTRGFSWCKGGRCIDKESCSFKLVEKKIGNENHILILSYEFEERKLYT